MKRHIKVQVMIVFIIFLVFLFPCGKKYGYNTHTEDKGPDVSDTSSKWYFTYYSDGNGGLAHTNPNTGENFKQSDWTVNDTYGWHEWEYNGTKYVVMAAATCEYLDDLPSTHYPFLSEKSNIHYFHYGSKENNWNYSTFQFKFVNNGDTNVYNGIVLDTCEMSIDPSNPAWNTSAGDNYGAKPENTQWLDVHVELKYPQKDKYNKFNGQEITLTSTGTWNTNSGESRTKGRNNKFFRTIIGLINLGGDTIQTWLNDLTSDGEGTSGDSDENKATKSIESTDLTVSKDQIEDDEELSKLINITDKQGTKDKNVKKYVEISNEVDSKSGQKEIAYNKDTDIPVIPVDIYSMSINKINILNVNFLKSSENNPNKFWKLIREIVSGFSHMTMYIAAIAILILIIVKSILLVKSTISGNPSEARDAKDVIDNIVKTIIVMSVIYLFMALMNNFYEQVLKLILNGNESNYIIRLYVKDTYEFNTNFIGFMKYLTMKQDIMTTFSVSLFYLLSAIANGIWFIFVMGVRSVIMIVLTIIAPITAAVSMLDVSGSVNVDNILHIKKWLITYLKWLWMPVVGLILYRIVLVFL